MDKAVFQKDGVIYSAVLGQTNITKNFNKYYKIQVLCCGCHEFQLYTTWGRIGRKGQEEFKNFKTPESAVREFETKFESKTGYLWNKRNEANVRRASLSIILRLIDFFYL